MADEAVVELIVGITVDPTGLMLLTLGAGGVLTELLQDSASIILPATRDQIEDAIGTLRVSKIIQGYRGQAPARMTSILDAVEAIIAYAKTEKEKLLELDINPLIVGADDAVAVDALIQLKQD